MQIFSKIILFTANNFKYKIELLDTRNQKGIRTYLKCFRLKLECDGTSFPEHNIGEECAEVGEVPRLLFRSKVGVPPFYGASSPKRRLHTLTCALGWQRAATDDAG